MAENLKLSENALKVLESRYLLQDNNSRETPAQLFRRVAKTVATAELKWNNATEAARWESEFYYLMSELLFLPNSPTLMNAGTPLNQLSACFVLPVEDNLSQIFNTLKQAAIIQQSGGGTGFNFSHLRPQHDPLTITRGTASGPLSFMKVFNSATEHIKHGGKRRGANMGILNIDHPDIEAFIESKRQKDELANFNISVGMQDAFMQAVSADQAWTLIHPKTGEVVSRCAATDIWRKIVNCAWETGDPGLIFLDTINRSNPTPAIGRIESTNPCGEVPLLPFEACNLGSVNLSRMIRRNQGIVEIDWNKLSAVVQTATRFLDDIIEINNYLLPEIREVTSGNRKIGLGVMGWADLLILLEIPYESGRAVRLAELVMQFIHQKTMEASITLASQRGEFPNWKSSSYYPNVRIRHATLNSIAPTGTISIIANTSSSIEPLFALAFERQHVLNEETLVTVNELFVDYLKRHEYYSDELMNRVMREGTMANEDLPQPVKNLFKTALEIAPSWHLQHQLAFQQFTDNAVSKTINLPESATQEDVAMIYRSAWEQGAKGITVYRNQSRGKQVLKQGVRCMERACKVCPG
jgi:ribonucleoside-diphosphate reductase alpha chain